ncbi:MAG: cobalamin biosynthesis protein CobW [Rhodospirillaceae bacterium]|jgi:cobalamin biosynthesis protein CobW|nr:cobalamin biosynthesis protein CobW [Rhodospirillaceae bacterium]MBT4941075.1 cobalamin biosynthesis protein CobW [Rhodospirillaceae bacterium]MBT5941233.1 cobalamin biosynthesis protein CobW [Rhodospirillaceae bacterium]MBT7265355.1 cobalamin biosynthesis protein CobW [Rhodospirillaceae bacterium]
MSLAAKTPVTVITGFLGAGKTSLIRHMLENANGKKLALIINEFGDLGIDGDILKGCGDETCTEDDVLELTNGCICCTVADDFIPTLEILLDREDRPDHIVIETSGLALPKPLVKAFQWPEVRSRTTVDGVITVVDGPAVKAGLFADDPELIKKQREADPTLDHENPLEEVFGDQLACADMVIVNKSDMLDGSDLNDVLALINGEARTSVEAIPAVHGRLDPGIILGLAAAVEDDVDQRPSCHDDEEEHEHDDFDTFTLDVASALEPALIVERVKLALGEMGVLRIKGVAEIEGKPARLVIQGVGERVDHYYDRPWETGENRASQLVVIGLQGFDRAAVEARLLK